MAERDEHPSCNLETPCVGTIAPRSLENWRQKCSPCEHQRCLRGRDDQRRLPRWDVPERTLERRIPNFYGSKTCSRLLKPFLMETEDESLVWREMLSSQRSDFAWRKRVGDMTKHKENNHTVLKQAQSSVKLDPLPKELTWETTNRSTYNEKEKRPALRTAGSQPVKNKTTSLKALSSSGENARSSLYPENYTSGNILSNSRESYPGHIFERHVRSQGSHKVTRNPYKSSNAILPPLNPETSGSGIYVSESRSSLQPFSRSQVTSKSVRENRLRSTKDHGCPWRFEEEEANSNQVERNTTTRSDFSSLSSCTSSTTSRSNLRAKKTLAMSSSASTIIPQTNLIETFRTTNRADFMYFPKR